MDNGIVSFGYYPQGMIGQDTVVEVINGETLEYTLEVSGENNIYSWYKDGTLLPGQTTSTLYIENASYADQGTYVLKVTNTMVPDLELVSHDVEVSILTDLEDRSAAGFHVYPNPVHGDVLTVRTDGSQEPASVKIFSTSGQLLISDDRSMSIRKIDISDLEQGFYLLQVYFSTGQTITDKIIVK
jgi:hypothetical protein